MLAAQETQDDGLEEALRDALAEAEGGHGGSEPAPAWMPSTLAGLSVDDLDLASCLRLFYQKIFPFHRMYTWLSYDCGQRNYFARREFSFTLANSVYLRFHSFLNEQDMVDKICKLNPLKIDIGAVYTARPSEKKSIHNSSFRPLEKEMVFDIDMTDYNSVRTCCQDKGVCTKCWKLIVIAVKIIDLVLQEDFGFQHLCWVFSGRRGVHCWVADERARKLDTSARRAIVSYIEVIKGGAEQKKKVQLNGDLFHPMISKSLHVAEPIFCKFLLKEQDILQSEEKWKKFVALFPDEAFRDGMSKIWAKEPMGPRERWLHFVQELEKFQEKKKFSMKHLKEEVMLQYCYPRLDANVSTQLNHLLKSPFCVHPDTGRICVPFVAGKVEAFDPARVPTVKQIIKELDDLKQLHLSPDKVALEKTSLAGPLEIFDAFLKKIEDSRQLEKAAAKTAEDAKMEF